MDEKALLQVVNNYATENLQLRLQVAQLQLVVDELKKPQPTPGGE